MANADVFTTPVGVDRRKVLRQTKDGRLFAINCRRRDDNRTTPSFYFASGTGATITISVSACLSVRSALAHLNKRSALAEMGDRFGHSRRAAKWEAAVPLYAGVVGPDPT